MKLRTKNNGSVFLMTIFAVALMAAVVTGMLQIDTEEIQVMRNQIFSAQALAIAEAGLNDAFSELRGDSGWTDGFTDKSFGGGSYTVTISGTLPNLTITSTGTSSQAFVARVEADVTVSSVSPYIVRIDSLRINE